MFDLIVQRQSKAVQIWPAPAKFRHRRFVMFCARLDESNCRYHDSVRWTTVKGGVSSSKSSTRNAFTDRESVDLASGLSSARFKRLRPAQVRRALEAGRTFRAVLARLLGCWRWAGCPRKPAGSVAWSDLWVWREHVVLRPAGPGPAICSR